MRKTKFKLSALLSLILCVVVCLTAALSLLCVSTKTVNGWNTTSQIVNVGEDGTLSELAPDGEIDRAVLNDLYTKLAGEGATLNTVKTAADTAAGAATAKPYKGLNSAELRAKNDSKDIIVKFGGLEWTVVYLSNDRNGDPVVTLWLKDSNQTKLEKQQFNSWTSESIATNTPYVSNIYSTSNARAQLNLGTPVSSSSTASARSVAQSKDSPFAAFTMTESELQGSSVKSLVKYIDMPYLVEYQSSESWAYQGNGDVNLPGSAYGYPLANTGTYPTLQANGYSNKEGSNFDYNSYILYSYMAAIDGTPENSLTSKSTGNLTANNSSVTRNMSLAETEIGKLYDNSAPAGYKWKKSADWTHEQLEKARAWTDAESWAFDTLWLPSVEEPGWESVSGMTETPPKSVWRCSKAQRANAGGEAWLRSGRMEFACYTDALGVSGDYVVGTNVATSFCIRPALHLNLKSAEDSVHAGYFTEIGSANNDLYNDTTGKFNYNLLQELYKDVSGSEGYKSLLTAAAAGKASADIREYNGGKNLSIWFGGKKWDVVHLTTTRGGEPIVTLWQSVDNVSATSKWANRESSSNNPTAAYPDNMYSTSLIRVQALNAGGYMSTSGTVLGNLTPQDSNNPYARFTMSSADKSLVKYIVQPKDVAYQEIENAKDTSSIGYTLPNDAYGSIAGEWYNNSYNYAGKGTAQEKAKYEAWQDDYLWLPSLAETGYDNSKNGVWKTNTAIRSTILDNAWLRSGFVTSADGAHFLNNSGSSSGHNVVFSYLVRPALHLNLTAAAKSAGIDVPVAKGDTEKTYTGEDLTFALDNFYEQLVKLDKVEKDGVNYTQYTFTETTGEFKVKKAGVYTLTFTPKDGGVWKSGGSSAKNVQFTVKKATIGVDGTKEDNLDKDAVYSTALEKIALQLPQTTDSDKFPFTLCKDDDWSGAQFEYYIETHPPGNHASWNDNISTYFGYVQDEKQIDGHTPISWKTYSSSDSEMNVTEPNGYCVFYRISGLENYETLYGYFSVHIYDEELEIKFKNLITVTEDIVYGSVSHSQEELKGRILNADNIEIWQAAKEAEGEELKNDVTAKFLGSESEKAKFRFYFKKSGSENKIYPTEGNYIGVGTYYVYIEYIGDNDHITFKWLNSAGDEQRPSFTVTPKEIELQIEDKGHIYGQQPATMSIADPAHGTFVGTDGISDLGTINYTYKEQGGGLVTLSSTLKVGTYTISATAAETNYKVKFIDGTYTVSQAAVKKPSGDNINDVYKGAEYELTVSDYDGSTMKYTTDGDGAAFNGGVFTARNAGEYTLTISLKDEDNYTWEGGGTDPVILKITIGKATIDSSEFTYDDGNRVWTGDAQNLTVSGYPADILSYSVEYYSGGVKLPSAPVDEGEYTVKVIFTLIGDGVGNYNDVPEKDGLKLVITKRAVAAPTEDTTEYTYTGEEFTYMPEGYDPLTMDIENNVHTDAGKYQVKVRIKDSTAIFAGYNKNEIEFEFNINPAQIFHNDNGNVFIQEEVTGSTGTHAVMLAEKDEGGKFVNFDAVNDRQMTIWATAPLPYEGGGKPARPEFDGHSRSAAYTDITSLNINDDEYPLTVDLRTVKKYVIYYRIEADNHEPLEGEWKVSVQPDSEVTKVIFKKAVELSYGDVPTTAELFTMLKNSHSDYLEITRDGVDVSADFFGEATGVTYGLWRKNQFGQYYDCGEYYINFVLPDDSSRTVIYREGGNDSAADTNRDKLKITQRELSISWNKLTYEISEGHPIALTSLTELATLDTSNLAQDGGPVSVRFELADHTQVITAEGEYQVTAVLEGLNAKNYRFADSATVTNTIVVTAAVQPDVSEQPSENQPQTPPATSEDKDGIPWWVWLIVGIGAALIVAAIIIVIVVMKRRKPEKEVVIRDINSDDDGFYDEVDDK